MNSRLKYSLLFLAVFQLSISYEKAI